MESGAQQTASERIDDLLAVINPVWIQGGGYLYNNMAF